jgi:hypothetical protein
MTILESLKARVAGKQQAAADSRAGKARELVALLERAADGADRAGDAERVADLTDALDFEPRDVELLAVGVAELRKLEAQPSPADAAQALEAAIADAKEKENAVHRAYRDAQQAHAIARRAAADHDAALRRADYIESDRQCFPVLADPAAGAAFNPAARPMLPGIREARERLGYGTWQPQPAGE